MLLQDVVVVVLECGGGGVGGRDGVGSPAAAAAHHDLVLLVVDAAVLAEEILVLERVLVPGDELLLAVGAEEARLVEDLVLGAHHEVVLAEEADALVTLGTEQSGKNNDVIIVINLIYFFSEEDTFKIQNSHRFKIVMCENRNHIAQVSFFFWILELSVC